MSSDFLPVQTFSTDGINPAEKHEAWRMQGWPSVAQICEFEAEPGFSAETRTIMIPGATIIHGFYGGQQVHRTASLIRSTPIDNLHITIPMRADVQIEHGHVSPGAAIVIDLAREWQHRASSGTMYTISIPRPIALMHGIDPREVHGAVIDPIPAALLREHVKQVAENAAAIPACNGDRIAETVINLLAVAFSVRGQLIAPAPVYDLLNLKNRALRLIALSLRGPAIEPETLVEKLATSRSKLYRLFEEEGGLQKEIKRQRLAAAQRALREGNDPIGTIAMEYGFIEVAHFSRSFKSEFGMTPKEWRKLGADPQQHWQKGA